MSKSNFHTVNSKANRDWRLFFQDQYKEKYKSDLYLHIVSKLEIAINESKQECVIFESDNLPYICVVYDNEYVNVLIECLTVFIDIEEYEICAHIKTLMEQLTKSIVSLN